MGIEDIKVLVVDDDDKVRASLEKLFKSRGWEVVTASCGRDALDSISSGVNFDAVIADYFMPNMNGLDFLRRVNMRDPGVYCIMLTAYPSSHAIVSAQGQYLKADLVLKPWTDNLISMIEDALQGRRDNGGQVS